MHRVLRAAVQIVTGPFGGVILEAINAIAPPPIEMRRERWTDSITTAVNYMLAQNHATYDELINNESFISTIMHATTIAMRSHEKEKLEALRNAVLNSCLPTAPDDFLRHIFLNSIDFFTPLHILALKRMDGVLSVGSPEEVILELLPECIYIKSVHGQIFQDLSIRGMVDHETNNSFGYDVNRSDIGNKFLVFIDQQKL